MDIEFHYQVTTIVTSTLTILEFYALFYKDLKIFCRLSTMVQDKILYALQWYFSDSHPSMFCRTWVPV